MATSIQSSRIWNGLKVDEVTYTETGKIELNSTGGSLLASSSNSDWEIEDTELFTRLYNNRARYSAQLTTTEFEKTFYNEGRPLFNLDRAAVLNDNTNYSNLTAAENNRTQFFKNGIPGLQNPVTGQVVNNDGTFTNGNPFGLPPQSLNNGVPSQFGTYAFPNDHLKVGSIAGQDTEGTVDLPQGRAARSGGFQSMRYPVNYNPQFPGDFLKITAHKYKARGARDGNYVPGSAIGGTASDRLGPSLGSVLLPLQAGLEEKNVVEYEGETLNFIEAAFGDAAFRMIDIGSDNPTNVVGMAKEGIRSLRDSADNALGDVNTTNYLKAYFAGQAIGKNLRRRLTGSIANPNLELFFKSPTLRNFAFTFKLTPRSSEEALVIKRIIKFFKKSMNPRKSGSEAFLYTPDIFQLQYVYQDSGQHPFLHKFKPTALTSFNVRYGNPTEYMTYGEDGSMPTYQISLAFKELEPLYDKDFDTESDDMGF
jgi:hypothetical protein